MRLEVVRGDLTAQRTGAVVDAAPAAVETLLGTRTGVEECRFVDFEGLLRETVARAALA